MTMPDKQMSEVMHAHDCALERHPAIALDNARVYQSTKDDMICQRKASEAAQWLAAIVESSDDAILSKDLNGIIVTWNKGAEHLFGYTSVEAIGKPIALMVPKDRENEEPSILARIRRGERIDRFETVRCRKGGTQIDISLSISPIKNAAGMIIGASTIARDITDRQKALHQQSLLLREMNHRIKNLFTLASSVVSLSAKSAKSAAELTQLVRERLVALARAQDLTLPKLTDESTIASSPTTFLAVIQTIVSPYLAAGMDARIRIDCPDIPLKPTAATSFALLLHEFTTNATKYGALSSPDGHVEIECKFDGEHVVLGWKEVGGPQVQASEEVGFGSILTEAAAKQLGGTIERDWKPEGVEIRLLLPPDQL